MDQIRFLAIKYNQLSFAPNTRDKLLVVKLLHKPCVLTFKETFLQQDKCVILLRHWHPLFRIIPHVEVSLALFRIYWRHY
jgi:hypothetical protein